MNLLYVMYNYVTGEPLLMCVLALLVNIFFFFKSCKIVLKFIVSKCPFKRGSTCTRKSRDDKQIFFEFTGIWCCIYIYIEVHYIGLVYWFSIFAA